jgi:hypothetical protein
MYSCEVWFIVFIKIKFFNSKTAQLIQEQVPGFTMNSLTEELRPELEVEAGKHH